MEKYGVRKRSESRGNFNKLLQEKGILFCKRIEILDDFKKDENDEGKRDR